MITGQVKWFNESKGFGFVVSGNKDYFVHYSEIQGTGFKTLKDGETVQFDAASSPKGLIAKSVSVCHN